MLKIAITGNIASGKSYVEQFFRDKGYAVFDTDKIAHEILENSPDVKNAFKNFDILSDGKIDRKKMAGLVFSDKTLLTKLENIIHPLVKDEILKIFNSDYEIVFVSVPQLFEAGFEDMFDKIIFVSADEIIRLKRLMKRNNLTKGDALKRINAQLPESYKTGKCDIVIENNGTKEELAEILSRIQFSK